MDITTLWLCKSKQPKLDNTNTPIRPEAGCSKNNENVQQINGNVTRSKITIMNDDDSPLILDDTLPRGDTLKKSI